MSLPWHIPVLSRQLSSLQNPELPHDPRHFVMRNITDTSAYIIACQKDISQSRDMGTQEEQDAKNKAKNTVQIFAGHIILRLCLTIFYPISQLSEEIIIPFKPYIAIVYLSLCRTFFRTVLSWHVKEKNRQTVTLLINGTTHEKCWGMDQCEEDGCNCINCLSVHRQGKLRLFNAKR